MDSERHSSLPATALAWSSQSANVPPLLDEEAGAEVDEPPDSRMDRNMLVPGDFRKTSVRKQSDRQSSLLTRALLSQQDEDTVVSDARSSIQSRQRRRSMTSNISLASTVDLTSDTGLTSPSRADTPSPPLPEMLTLRIQEHGHPSPKLRFGGMPAPTTNQPSEEPPRKKSITFACLGKPDSKPVEQKPSAIQFAPSAVKTDVDPPRKPCIKFACPNITLSAQPTKVHLDHSVQHPQSPPGKEGTNRSRGAGYDEPKEDDWIREEHFSPKKRITIKDTLVKEDHIRRIAEEAEEEAEQEEDDDDNDGNEDLADEDDDGDDDIENDDGDEDDDDDGDDDDEDEDDTEYGSVEGDDGYHTDEETGFAESDEDEDDDLHLWNHGIKLAIGASPHPLLLRRRSSAAEHHSDSSTATHDGLGLRKMEKTRRRIGQPAAPELPDSTDFVCGTFDEDREVEEAYLSHRAAVKAQKTHLIPQDIDPSFPTSDIEDGDGEELFNPVHDETDEHIWEMDDVHHDKERCSRKKTKGAQCSPKRYHSPPPKPRGRSPRGILEKHSPRRMRSPAPAKAINFARASPISTRAQPRLAGLYGPVANQTKSLPRPGGMITFLKASKKGKMTSTDNHVRGAIDIVKGLEKKRQRRKEKYFQKYCNRARKGQVQERKPLPGQGATKMRELGLLMAGKTDRGNYVLSV
ncbi:hypothetical protein jhhlp_002030 [Lomentospora prolificans]|uniref:Uncharacterized protein n=1 Tax=Lomentospora prolificans TaxID=41688 RepID=A0A2N3NCX5_9PEZI|nr:hypothetical protein jhhlp_002030 [Lomentospora prolificans]